MASELIPLVLRAALFASLTILVLLLLRRPLRRWVGASLAYQAWLLVPLVVLASLLPARPAAQLLSVQVLRPVQALAIQATPSASPRELDYLLLAWACGTLAAAAWFILGHRAFLRKAGRLTRSGDLYVSTAGAGPASLGLVRPRIIVPHDFAQRYTAAEQALVLAHEQVHVARRDALANLLTAAFQCAFWFNPIVHLGARFLRQDQELACDAAVMRHHPRQRRTYAEALLKSHTGAFAATGLHCHWQSQHPTKERIMSLQHNPPGTFRRLAGRCTLALLAACAFSATLGARAEQAGSAQKYTVALTIATATEPTIAFKLQADEFIEAPDKSLPRVVTAAGEKFSVSKDEWRMEMTIHPANKPDEVWLAGKIFQGSALVSAPTLLARTGEAASVKVGEGDKAFSMGMTVTPQP